MNIIPSHASRPAGWPRAGARRRALPIRQAVYLGARSPPWNPYIRQGGANRDFDRAPARDSIAVRGRRLASGIVCARGTTCKCAHSAAGCRCMRKRLAAAGRPLHVEAESCPGSKNSNGKTRYRAITLQSCTKSHAQNKQAEAAQPGMAGRFAASGGIKKRYSFRHAPVSRPDVLAAPFNRCLGSAGPKLSQKGPSAIFRIVTLCHIYVKPHRPRR